MSAKFQSRFTNLFLNASQLYNHLLPSFPPSITANLGPCDRLFNSSVGTTQLGPDFQVF